MSMDSPNQCVPQTTNFINSALHYMQHPNDESIVNSLLEQLDIFMITHHPDEAVLSPEIVQQIKLELHLDASDTLKNEDITSDVLISAFSALLKIPSEISITFEPEEIDISLFEELRDRNIPLKSSFLAFRRATGLSALVYSLSEASRVNKIKCLLAKHSNDENWKIVLNFPYLYSEGILSLYNQLQQAEVVYLPRIVEFLQFINEAYSTDDKVRKTNADHLRKILKDKFLTIAKKVDALDQEIRAQETVNQQMIEYVTRKQDTSALVEQNNYQALLNILGNHVIPAVARLAYAQEEEKCQRELVQKLQTYLSADKPDRNAFYLRSALSTATNEAGVLLNATTRMRNFFHEQEAQKSIAEEIRMLGDNQDFSDQEKIVLHSLLNAPDKSAVARWEIYKSQCDAYKYVHDELSWLDGEDAQQDFFQEQRQRLLAVLSARISPQDKREQCEQYILDRYHVLREKTKEPNHLEDIITQGYNFLAIKGKEIISSTYKLFLLEREFANQEHVQSEISKIESKEVKSDSDNILLKILNNPDLSATKRKRLYMREIQHLAEIEKLIENYQSDTNKTHVIAILRRKDVPATKRFKDFSAEQEAQEYIDKTIPTMKNQPTLKHRLEILTNTDKTAVERLALLQQEFCSEEQIKKLYKENIGDDTLLEILQDETKSAQKRIEQYKKKVGDRENEDFYRKECDRLLAVYQQERDSDATRILCDKNLTLQDRVHEIYYRAQILNMRKMENVPVELVTILNDKNLTYTVCADRINVKIIEMIQQQLVESKAELNSVLDRKKIKIITQFQNELNDSEISASKRLENFSRVLIRNKAVLSTNSWFSSIWNKIIPLLRFKTKENLADRLIMTTLPVTKFTRMPQPMRERNFNISEPVGRGLETGEKENMHPPAMGETSLFHSPT